MEVVFFADGRFGGNSSPTLVVYPVETWALPEVLFGCDFFSSID